MRHDVDVVILGAGPAGCAAALSLARAEPQLAGRTVLLERRSLPRPKGCAGGLTGRVPQLLRALGLPDDPPGAVPIGGVRLSHADNVTHVELTRPLSVIRRAPFDGWLADAARGAIGELREDEPARELRRDGDRIEVHTDRGTWRARAVIDASGARSVARRSRLMPGGSRPVPVWVAEGPPVDGEAVWNGGAGAGAGALRFDFTEMGRGCAGYYWSFPAREGGQRWVSRGLYPAVDVPASVAREALARRLRAEGVDPDGVRAVAYPARLFTPGEQLSAPGLVLAGDAAGVDPLFGEGIAHSLEYGLLAGPAVGEAVRRGRPEALARSPYRGSALLRRLTFMDYAARRFYVPGYQRRLAFALDTRVFLKLVLAENRGDAPGPLLWFAGGALGLARARFGRLELDVARQRRFRL